MFNKYYIPFHYDLRGIAEIVAESKEEAMKTMEYRLENEGVEDEAMYNILYREFGIDEPKEVEDHEDW